MLSMIGSKPTFLNNKSIKEYALNCQTDYMKRIVQENKDKDKYKKKYLNLNNIDSFKEFDEYITYQRDIPNTNPNNFSSNPIFLFLSISSIFFIYSTRN